MLPFTSCRVGASRRRWEAGLLLVALGGVAFPSFAAEAPAAAVHAPPSPEGKERTASPYGTPADDAMIPMLAETIALRRAVDVEGPFVTLGDLFTGVGEKADVAVARAPRPGRSSTLDAQWLSQAARTYGVAWTPRSPLDQAVVTRPGVTVAQDLIEQALRPVLVNLGASDSMSMEITNARTSLSVPPGEPPTLRVLEETYDPQTRRFTAVLEAPAGAPDAQRVQIAGRFLETREVPVLIRRIGRGERIRTEDVVMQRVRADGLPADVLTDPMDVVGMEVQGAPREGHPLRRVDVSRPQIVRKGALVTMELRVPGMVLTARGRTMEGGSQGEAIRVTNLASNQVVMATVAGPDLVVVSPASGSRPQTASR
ncbi:flagellar basal body P-ring formation chaperone FlgA [Pararhodospirillum photometricum]|uniref:Flageller protein FlgA n=1 Tax=Pararhodospirillum photometricum DSM 122 TaxID=1150469 RepID=H6SME3_PARPM|nr:flagellar basal body P-ring formation chaperone FlgA [Pararhodospirillum photometricum]CCG06826.1 Flageller protein FlgA [Pararhodospirillum photometricum DSM 122]